MKQIKVVMRDLLSENEELIERFIDISNFSIPNYKAQLNFEHNIITEDENKQKEILENWISERANDQHETLLELVSWEIV